jgi:ABC-type dipeptide/oligopeptide/nickel transport system permease component
MPCLESPRRAVSSFFLKVALSALLADILYTRVDPRIRLA